MSKVFKSSYVSVNMDNVVRVHVSPVETAYIAEELEPEIDFSEIIEGPTAEEILESARKEANKIIAAANSKADEIVENSRRLAEREADDICNAAEERGYEEGFSKGAAEAEGLKAKAEKIVKEAYGEKEEIMLQAEPEIIDLVSDLVKKILIDEVMINKQVISALVKQGLKQTNLIGNINIHISRFDYENILENKDDILSSVETTAIIEFTQDIGLKQGDCIIETDFGSIDCGVSAQYKELKNSLYFLLKNR